MSFAFRIWSILIAFALALTAADVQKPTVKRVPMPSTSRVSGVEMFKSYCASCHGIAGKGDGPAASAMNHRPTDLTLLSKNNQGKFPDLHVSYVLGMKQEIAAHGSKEMPVWGSLFSQMENGDDTFTKLRIRNLVTYIESLQGK
jgi:mono/diheme cytochrome c family protein